MQISLSAAFNIFTEFLSLLSHSCNVSQATAGLKPEDVELCVIYQEWQDSFIDSAAMRSLVFKLMYSKFVLQKVTNQVG